MNPELNKILITPKTPILQAMRIIDNNAIQITLVVDKVGRLCGTVTDGDIRRGILRGISLDEPVMLIMNSKPTFVSNKDKPEKVIALMRHKRIHHMPVVDADGRVVKLEVLDDLLQVRIRENIVVLMAGGLGTRLRPLTDDCPKPLLQVGDKPLLETIITNFIDYGFRTFYIAVNYKADMIENYFSDGARWGADIRYLREQKRLGTAGALGMLPVVPDKPLIIMNGDLLTQVNFPQLLDFHDNCGADATMCVREYSYQVPFGVVSVNNNRLVDIKEKPVQSFFVSAGIYVLNPAVLNLIEKDTYLDMPSLFSSMIGQDWKTVAFPIREYWTDVGHMKDFERANGEFFEVFNK